MKTSYYTINDQILGERSSGNDRINYAPDALGSVIGTIASGSIQNRYSYGPYGFVQTKAGNGADPVFTWIGSRGYRSTTRRFAEQYARARGMSTTTRRWISRDPRWPEEQPYAYAKSNPLTLTDPTGLGQSFVFKKAGVKDIVVGTPDPGRIMLLWPADGYAGCDITSGATWIYIPYNDSPKGIWFYTMPCLIGHEELHSDQFRRCCFECAKEVQKKSSFFVWNYWREAFYHWVDKNVASMEAAAYRESWGCLKRAYDNAGCDRHPETAICRSLETYRDNHEKAYRELSALGEPMINCPAPSGRDVNTENFTFDF